MTTHTNRYTVLAHARSVRLAALWAEVIRCRRVFEAAPTADRLIALNTARGRWSRAG